MQVLALPVVAEAIIVAVAVANDLVVIRNLLSQSLWQSVPFPKT